MRGGRDGHETHNLLNTRSQNIFNAYDKLSEADSTNITAAIGDGGNDISMLQVLTT
jgi:magnesium-transporting ATPase (P-type)